MNVELLMIRNEILIGKTQDTNSNWMAKRITKFGHRVNRITTIGDDLDINEVLKTMAIAVSHRGYDSTGVWVVIEDENGEKKLVLRKVAGAESVSMQLRRLAEDPMPEAGLGGIHIRWATQGPVSAAGLGTIAGKCSVSIVVLTRLFQRPRRGLRHS